MLSFSTEFPVPDTVSNQDFSAAVTKWILGSRFTQFKIETLDGLGVGESWDSVEENETIESWSESTADSCSVAVLYRKSDEDFVWITTIVFCAQPSSTWISIRVECEPLHPTAKVPNAKKPVLVRTLLNSLGAGADGDLLVVETPVVFASSEIELAKSCIVGTTNSYLPIVYISAPFGGQYLVDPNELASLLFGMAHVVVEPNRIFSTSVMGEVQRKNVYGGTIGLYWPEGGGRRSFFVRAGQTSPEEIKLAIFDEIRLSLINRRPLVRCTLAAVKELQSRRLINNLKDAGSAEVASYIEAFENELGAKSSALSAAESEISRLKAEIRRYEAQDRSETGLLLNTGGETDFYEDEILDTVRDALLGSIARVTADGRRQHLLQSIVEANPISAERARYRDKIKSLLRDYHNMDARTKKDLEEIGFSISDSGKHFKLIYQDDSRYTFTLAKSGSDYRGGLNAAGDLCRLLF